MSEKESQLTSEKDSSDAQKQQIESKADSWVKAWEAHDSLSSETQENQNRRGDDSETLTDESIRDERIGLAGENSMDFSQEPSFQPYNKNQNTQDPFLKKNEIGDLEEGSELEPVVMDETRVRRKLTYIFFISFFIFVAWAVYAPIDAGVTTQGQVVVSGYRKAVQHPTGGVIREILVSDGDFVEEGQTLIKINPLTLQANLGTIETNYITILATEARLKAERFNTSITWPTVFQNLTNQDQIKEVKTTQEALFKARRREFIDTIQARQSQLKSLITEEQNLSELAKEGLVPKASAEQAMRNRLESENLINTFKSTFIKQVETDLVEAQKQRESLQLQLEAAKFDEAHASIQSPATGTIIGLKVVTVGGVITSGQLLAEVVPKDTKLVVDAKLPATVIDKVKVGALVDLHFTAFNAATTPTVPGRVTKVGSDRVLPDKSKPGEPDFEYYAAQVETTEEGLAMLGQLEVKPGMPVDVVIKTGTRSFLSWLIKPIADRVIWAFK